MLTSLFAAAAMLDTPARLVALRPNLDFPAAGQSLVKEFDDIDPGIAFDEVIPSWNVDNPSTAAVKIELRVTTGGRKTKWYVLGDWAYDPVRQHRGSQKSQKDADGNVLTDTLSLKKTGQALDVRVTLRSLGEGPTPRLRLLTLSFLDSSKPTEDKAERSEAWGKVLDVPQRAQGNYPGGGVLCSATSVSMILWHWSIKLQRPELNKDVPEVQGGVWDFVYDGAGNWPFNAAYAGSQPGMVGYVARLASISDAEKWIAAGIPIACSAPLDLLRGNPQPGDSGHLVVLVGFTANGDPIFNDPAKRDEVRRTYKRENFEKAWKTSNRTVYLIYPQTAHPPADESGRWMTD